MKQSKGPLSRTSCNDRQIWSTLAWPMSKVAAAALIKHAEAHGLTLPATAQARAKLLKSMRGPVFWWMIRSLTVAGGRHNAAALPLRGRTTASGQPLWLIRSGYTAAPTQQGSCYQELVSKAGVRHTLNLYDGEMYTADLDAGERTIVTAAGGTYTHPTGMKWRAETRSTWKVRKRSATDAQAYVQARSRAFVVVTKLILGQLLAPGGKKPMGHLHVHCGGGMHRTGMVVGVLDRCINGTPMSQVERDYKRHVGWRSAAVPGGFEAQNLDFIRTFPCGPLLKNVAQRRSE
ncbi:MAG: hypothetical protein KC502_16940 [Myxococcales bacterium]|nr:hypothetical protein [Myxococcales bacterium]